MKYFLANLLYQNSQDSFFSIKFVKFLIISSLVFSFFVKNQRFSEIWTTNINQIWQHSHSKASGLFSSIFGPVPKNSTNSLSSDPEVQCKTSWTPALSKSEIEAKDQAVLTHRQFRFFLRGDGGEGVKEGGGRRNCSQA